MHPSAEARANPWPRPPVEPRLAAQTERQRRASSYTRREQRFRARAEALGPRSRRLRALGGLCLAAAAVLLLGVLLGEAPPIALPGVLVVLGACGVLIARHARLHKAEDEAWRWREVNASGQSRCQDTWRGLPENGAELVIPDHHYSNDLDIFGPGSLFQLINVAHTLPGKRTLARFLTERVPLAESASRQAAVRWLAPQLTQRQRLETLTLRALPAGPASRASLLRLMPKVAASPRSEEEALLEWAESPPLYLPRTLTWAARVLPLLAVLGFVASQAFEISSVPWKLAVALQALLVVWTRRAEPVVLAGVGHFMGEETRRVTSPFSSVAATLQLPCTSSVTVSGQPAVVRPRALAVGLPIRCGCA